MSYKVRYSRKVLVGKYETAEWSLEQEFPADVPRGEAFRLTRDMVLKAIEDSKRKEFREAIEALGWKNFEGQERQWIHIEKAGETAKRLAERIRSEGKDGVWFAYGYRYAIAGEKSQFIHRTPIRKEKGGGRS